MLLELTIPLKLSKASHANGTITIAFENGDKIVFEPSGATSTRVEYIHANPQPSRDLKEGETLLGPVAAYLEGENKQGWDA
jgi:hypothetical protein